LREGLIETNPVIATNKAIEEVPRDRVLTNDELAAIWRTCQDNAFGRIVKLLILTGQRRDEVGGLVRSEVDPAGAKWNLPSHRTKNGQPHEVPLSATALSIVTAAMSETDQSGLFGPSGSPFTGWSSAKTAFDRRLEEAGYKIESWRLHDLRRTAATRLADLGTLPHVIEAVLNHMSGHKAGVAGIYNRATYAKEKREALDAWAEHLSKLVGNDKD
jgi:integrase